MSKRFLVGSPKERVEALAGNAQVPGFQACVSRVRPGDCTPNMEQKVAQLPYFERLWAWFETNKKQALWGALIVAVLGVII